MVSFLETAILKWLYSFKTIIYFYLEKEENQILSFYKIKWFISASDVISLYLKFCQ